LADIFISYAREDIGRVRPLVTALQTEGFSIWWDGELSPGDRFEETIDEEIQAAACVVVVWTDVSVGSRWVKNEALEGMDRDILVPVLMDNVRLPVAFKQTQIADFTQWPDNVDEDQYTRLVQSINAKVHDEPRDSKTLAGVASMKTRGGRRFRRKRDFLVPALAVAVIVLAAAVAFLSGRPADPGDDLMRITVDHFRPDDDENSRFYADSITREVQQQLASVDNIELVQVGGFWDLEAVLYDTNEHLASEVDYVLTGDVSSSNDTLTIKAELHRTDSDRVVWARSLSAPETDFLDLQNRLILSVLGELNLANNQIENVTQVTTDKIAYRDYLLGQDLMRRGEETHIQQAIERFESALERDPNFTLALASICRANLELFRLAKNPDAFEEGQESCSKMLELTDRGVDANLAIAELYLTSGELESAKIHFSSVLEIDPENSDANIGLATILVNEDDMQRALTYFEIAAKAHPTYWKAHNALGGFYFRSGMYHRAIESYLRVTELTDGNPTALSNLGAARLYAGDFDGAYDAWQAAIDVDSNAASYSNIGTALYYGNRLSEAVSYYEAALEVDPTDHRLWGNLADALMLGHLDTEKAVNAYQEAIRLAEAVIEVNPDDAYSLSRLAVYHAAMGNDELALKAMERAQNIASLDINVMYDIAVALKLMDRREEATKYKDRALEAGYPAVLMQADPQLNQL
jgi:tetratricopeptide (TPR) repeat protein